MPATKSMARFKPALRTSFYPPALRARFAARPPKNIERVRQQLSQAIDDIVDNHHALRAWLRRVDDETLMALADAGLERVDFKPQEVTVVLRQIPLNVAEGEKALNAGARLRDTFLRDTLTSARQARQTYS